MSTGTALDQTVRRSLTKRDDPRIERGLRSEDIVCELLVAHERIIVARRLRTPFAEVDIVATDRTRERYLMVEVKTQCAAPWSDGIIARAQMKRLRRAREWLECEHRRPVAAALALVSREGRVRWAADFLC